MSRVFAPFTLFLALCCVLSTPALAWKRSEVPKFRGGKATWWSVSPSWNDEMRAVAAQLKATGANVRLTKAVSAKAASILVKRPIASAAGCHGEAQMSWSGRKRFQSKVVWYKCMPEGTHAEQVRDGRRANISLLAHEVMHTYGFNHETRRCALMNTTLEGSEGGAVPNKCTSAKKEWVGYVYCRVLEADDIRGLVAVYGGTRKSVKPARCLRGIPVPTAFTAVQSASDIVGDPTDGTSIDIGWTTASGTTGVKFSLFKTACPAASILPFTVPTTSIDYAASPGSSSGTVDLDSAGVWCAALATTVGDSGDFFLHSRYTTTLVTAL